MDREEADFSGKKALRDDTALYCNAGRFIMKVMSTHIYKDASRESGNVIWFIMLAIALTAALTMTLSRSSDTGGQTGDIERARVQASEIMRYAGGIEQAVERAILRGTSENAISFENSFVSGYANGRCPDTDQSNPCFIFGRGGGQAYMKPRPEWLDGAQGAQPLFAEWYFTGHVCVQDMGTGGAGCASDGSNRNEELVMVLPWIKEDICRQINALLKIPGAIPVESGGAWPAAGTKYQGVFADGEILNQPRMAGCFAGSGSDMPPANSYSYFHVLIDR